MAFCRQAIAGRVLTTPDKQFEGVEWLGFNQAPEFVVTVALSASSHIFGWLSMGTNPHRPFDDACDEYIKDMTRRRQVYSRLLGKQRISERNSNNYNPTWNLVT